MHKIDRFASNLSNHIPVFTCLSSYKSFNSFFCNAKCDVCMCILACNYLIPKEYHFSFIVQIAYRAAASSEMCFNDAIKKAAIEELI